MSVGDWVFLGLIVLVIAVAAVIIVRLTTKSQAQAIAEKTAADKAAFDAKRQAILAPTPEERVAALKPPEVTDELNKL